VGGKSTHILELLGPAVHLTSVDSGARKLELLAEHARRLGLPEPEMHTLDLTASAPALRDGYDVIVLDAPCTGLGVARRRPDVRWRRHADDVTRMAELQGRLLAALASRVAPGGVLIYSVCTYTAAEGEGVVQAFLASHPQFSVELPAPVPGTGGVPWADLGPGPRGLHLLPSRHDTDGFFAARLRRG
jgi:16S rRNA (cytosine967-C5)-methyltransferase